LTPGSCRTHQSRSGQALRKIAELGENHAFLEAEARTAQKERTKVQEARERLRQFARQFKLPSSTLGL
jgi:hypothetical protein